MKRIKVINEPTELVPVMRAMDTEVKRKVFMEVSTHWCTAKTIEELYGLEGRQALNFFEKMKLVETRWESVDSISEKAYHRQGPGYSRGAGRSGDEEWGLQGTGGQYYRAGQGRGPVRRGHR